MSKTVAIVGAGLAGAACANAFARAGFKVTVFERGTQPAAGASGVPLAMFAPSVSSDDAPHSRLLRRGVNVLMEELHRLTSIGLLQAGADWACNGAQERCIRGDKRLPRIWLEPKDPVALQSKVLEVLPDSTTQCIQHGAAGWVNPKRLVAAWLSHTSIKLETDRHMGTLEDSSLLGHSVIVLACGYQTAELVPTIKNQLQPIRGQVEWGESSALTNPIHGYGHWIEGAGKWLVGATFQRDETALAARAKDVALNFEKLELLRPELKVQRVMQLRAAAASWVGVRTAQKNRSPLVERIEATNHLNTWLCTGLGSRGLSLAALCASQLLAAVQHRLSLF